MSIKNILCCLVILLPLIATAQQRKIGPEQDCPGALPICDSVFTQTNSYSGFGKNHNELPSTTCLQNNENNSVWYIFNTSSAGYFQMILSPLDGVDDYDYALYDITGHTCADIATGIAPEVRCNYTLNDTSHGGLGVNTGFGHGGTGTSSPPYGPSFNDSVMVDNTPHTFVLLINDFRSGGSGYTLNFSGSTANIVDTVIPKVAAISANSCNSPTSFITVKFSRPLNCDSIIYDGSQFTLTGPFPSTAQVAIDSAYDTACIDGTFTFSINIRTKTPVLQKGDYTLSIHQSIFGLHLVDLCDHELNDTNIIYHQQPVLNAGFTWSAFPSCNVDTIAFFNTITANDSAYLWEFGDGTTSTATNPPGHVYADTGTYRVTLVSYNATCADSITQSVHAGRSFYDFVFAPGHACPGVAVQFNDSVAGGQGTQFYYDFGDGVILQNTHNPTHTYNLPGVDTVKLIVTQSPENSPCNATATKVIIVDCDTTGIEQITPGVKHLSIYPNPAQNIATIEWEPVNRQLQFAVSDMLGREAGNFKADGKTGNTQIDISGFANGIYIVKLFTGNGTVISGKLAVGR